MVAGVTAKPTIFVRALGLSSTLALAACGAPSPTPSTGDAQVEPDTKTEAEPEEAKPAVLPEAKPELPAEGSPLPGGDEPGPVYLVINSKGVVRLDERGAALIAEAPTRNISAMFVGPDGGVYLVDAEALRKVVGDAVVEVERFSVDDVAPVDNLMLAADGSLWVTSRKRVGHRVDGSWSFTDFSEIGAEQGFEVELAGDGQVWLVGEGAAFFLDPADAKSPWKPSAPGLWTLLAPLRYPTSSPVGKVHAAADFKLVRLNEEIIDGVLLDPKKELFYSAGLSLASDGDAGLISQNCDLIRVNARPPTKMWRLEGDKYDCQTPEALALDSSDRFWVASREGLSLITDKRQVREYPAGSYEAIAGRVSHMVAVGTGPATAPTVERIKVAKLAGTIVYAGKPAAKVPVEACHSVRLDGEGTPCSAAKAKYTTTTDESGAFTFSGVAIGDYSVAVEIDGKWRWTTPPTFAAKLRAGEVHDLGALSFSRG